MLNKTKHVSLLEKIIYGSGDIGLNAMHTLFSSYVLFYYTDVIGINAAMIGTVVMFSKLFDGISDLIAGQLIDTHKGKGGHCIPVIMKWSLPMLASVVLVFMVPNTTLALKLAFIFVTYNLFNTVFYTYVCLAHCSLATYVTDNSEDRSQMLILRMLFAALTQTIMASTMLPMVDYFGGMYLQSAWIKSIMVFGAIGFVFLMLNVLFVKERVDNTAPPENIIASVKCALQNKYWLMAVVISLAANSVMTFNLSVSIYYLNQVMGNVDLMGTFIACSNLPGVVLCVICPFLLKKFTKRQMVMAGGVLMLVAQIIFILSPKESVSMLLFTALIRGIGLGCCMGLSNALIADTIDYGEWKTGTRVQGVLFSASSVGSKIGQGALTALFGIFLTSIGYDGTLKTQAASTISGISTFFKFGPLLIAVIAIITIYFFDIEARNPEIIKELEERKKC